ncbi:small GTP-binding protein [Histomonas meleagridis]|uniref:small GTP-binding protein n=1 Tax=Histomonas meleagridis TaxID=135588 RepID=UPI003559E0A2|nr:small GTP-binding protein [Histomonas meleagridis]KAH0805306.1 small GTP-binding protein [Histomonas meleagridis]
MSQMKVVIVGDTKVGKSCIINKYVREAMDKNLPPTVGAAFYTKVVQTQKGSVRLQLWDTAGQEKFRALAPMYYRSADVAVLVYDVTSKASLEGLEKWASEIANRGPPNVKLVVIGNKIDLEDARCISKEQGKELADRLGAVIFGETSAVTGEGINDIFNQIAQTGAGQDIIVDSQQQQPVLADKKEESKCC